MTKSKEIEVAVDDTFRAEKLKQLIAEEVVYCVGDQLVISKPQGPSREMVDIPFAVFVRKQEDPSNVYLATPTGIVLFLANELHNFAQDKAKEIYLGNLDRMLTDQKVIKRVIN